MMLADHQPTAKLMDLWLECLLHDDEALILLTLTNPGQAKLSVQEHCSLQVKIN